jgi:transcription antitermination factor NusG
MSEITGHHNWYVLWMPKGYREDTLVVLKNRLRRFGEFELFTPYYTVFKRKKFVKKFILPGYVFLKGTHSVALDDMLENIFKGSSILRNLRDVPAIILEEEIDHLRGEEQRYRGNPNESDLGVRVNDRVQVKEGPFDHKIGIVDRITEDFVFVNLELLSRDVAVPFRFYEVEKVT